MAEFHAIPTVYRGVQYRSRLEARWAAFFTLMGWRFQYEPFDLKGWIPDFALMGGPETVLVEVKPVDTFPEDVGTKVTSSGWEGEILIVGFNIDFDPDTEVLHYYTRRIGWIGHQTDPGEWDWRPALFGAWLCVIPSEIGYETVANMPISEKYTTGFVDSFGAWFNRVGKGGSQYYKEDNWLNQFVMDNWNQAGNLVQWRGRQSITN